MDSRMPKETLRSFWWRCARRAHRQAIAFANNWAWLWGVPIGTAVIVWFASAKHLAIAQVTTGNPALDGLLAGLGAFAITYGIRFVPRFVTAPHQLLMAERRRTAAAESEIHALTVKPERISLVDMAALAESRFDWDFKDSEKRLFFDFIDGIRHAVSDYYFSLEGRLNCMNQTEDRKNFYFLDPIPKEHIKEFQIEVFDFFRTPIGNYDIHTQAWRRSGTLSGYLCLEQSKRGRMACWEGQ